MTELDPVLISAIEHYSYCPRQCGLIHVESIYDENLLTMRGNRAHERVHDENVRSERGKTVLRGLPIWSEQYGLVGQADAIEVSPSPKSGLSLKDSLAAGNAHTLTPIEYKVGKKTRHKHALYQACAQALCLEEMFGLRVPKAAVYYVASRERESHELDDLLRSETAEIIESIRAMKTSWELPEPVADKRCPNCSLIDACMPFAVQSANRTSARSPFTLLPEVDLP